MALNGLDKWQRRLAKLRNHPRPMRFLASRALWHAGLSRWFIIELSDGLKLRFHPSSISAALWAEGDARSDDVAFLRSVLRPGDTYIDVGANIGHLAVIGRHCVGASGSVTAIEANPRIHGYCAANLELNGFQDVLVLNLALGDKRGTAHISDRRDDDQNRLGQSGRAVPMRTLDEVINVPHITLLKLDVEGFELAVLRGATHTLERTAIVYCELSDSNAARFGYEPRDAEQLLLDAGFVLAHQDEPGRYRLSTNTLFDHLAPAARPRTGYNVVAVKRQMLDDFTARLRNHGYTVLGGGA